MRHSETERPGGLEIDRQIELPRKLDGQLGCEPPPAPQPASQGVFLRGTLVDANTNQGVSGAVFIVFRAGVTQEQVQNASQQEGGVQNLFLTTAFTDQTGLYQTTAPLPRGETYLLLAGGESYQDRFLTVDITAEDPPLTELNPIAIQRQW